MTVDKLTMTVDKLTMTVDKHTMTVDKHTMTVDKHTMTTVTLSWSKGGFLLNPECFRNGNDGRVVTI